METGIEIKPISLKSPAFEEGSIIPSRYTCDGLNILPPLEISEIPQGTKTLLWIMEDPDSPTGVWDHWILFNAPLVLVVEDGNEPGGIQGLNSWGRLGYAGPCPGRGQHRYVFLVYALDTELSLASGATKAELEKSIDGHVIGKGELMGRYERKRSL